jgi:hypothetical protein
VIAELRSGWLQAGSPSASGRPVEAVQLGDDVERRAREMLRQLGVDMD